jgi:hypothetical protein
MRQQSVKSAASLSFPCISAGPASILLLIFSFLGKSTADYVETAPRPGAPLPPVISDGECPLVFLQSDIQHAKHFACTSSELLRFPEFSFTVDVLMEWLQIASEVDVCLELELAFCVILSMEVPDSLAAYLKEVRRHSLLNLRKCYKLDTQILSQTGVLHKCEQLFVPC